MKKHTKRFMVIFSIWGQKPVPREKRCDNLDSHEYVHNEVEFDSEKEWKEEVELIEKLYKDTPHPTERKGKCDEPKWNFTSEDERLWGYMVLDFSLSKVLRIGNDGIFDYKKTKTKNKVSLGLLDKLFRGDDEIPKNYSFDIGEYEGWLQFRWGDGRNRVT